MKRKDPLKILTNQTRANVSFLMMSSPNGTISSNVALNRRKLRKLLFTHYIILDDEEDFLFSQREHLVKVEGSKGLDKADVRVAIQILNTKEISQIKRWFYGALKFIAVYILMVMLFMAYFYWYPEKEINNMNRRALMYQECLRSHFHWQ